MQTNQKTVLVECERMKYPFTGLYNFCHHLSKALLDQETDLDFSFYVPASAAALFPEHKITIQKSYNKFFFPLKNSYLLWHCTYQNSLYIPLSRKLPVVLTIHDLNFMYDKQKNANKRIRYAKHLQKNINQAAHIVCISESTRKDVQEHLNTGNKPVSVIYNGCTVNDITHLEGPLFRPAGDFLFTVGTIMEKKNFHVLPGLLQNNHYQLVIAGLVLNESYKQRIIHEAEKAGVRDRVIFTGAVSENDKQWYYKNCTAFLFPSISEGFGLPVVEAMHFGKPVLLSKFTSLPEVGGAEAYYFDSYDPKDMQQKLADALTDYKVNNRIEAITQRSAFFSWKKAAEKYIEVYKSVAGV